MKRIFTLLLAITIIFSLTPKINAQEPEPMVTNYTSSESIHISDEYNTTSVSRYNSLDGAVELFHTAPMYSTDDFSQGIYNNNCAPTLMANVLSYFNVARGLYLNANPINQSVYNEMCNTMGYNGSSGKSLNDVSQALKNWSSRYGKTCIIDKYWFNTWGDVTRDIDNNKPVLLGYNGHAYLVLGYDVENGVKKLFVATAWSNMPYQFLTFTSGMEMQSVNIY